MMTTDEQTLWNEYNAILAGVYPGDESVAMAKIIDAGLENYESFECDEASGGD